MALILDIILEQIFVADIFNIFFHTAFRSVSQDLFYGKSTLAQVKSS